MFSVDFESFYIKGEYTLKLQDPWSYCFDERFDCYQVAIYGEGVDYVGPVADAPWCLINGQEWWSHNAMFDRLVKMRLDQDFAKGGPNPVTMHQPSAWRCTANLSVYHQAPRNLQGAAKQLLGVDLSKDYRDKANGKHWGDFTPEEQVLIREAGRVDARNCYELAKKYSPTWPDKEKRLAEMTFQMMVRGANIDWALHEQYTKHLIDVRHKALHSIPWIPEDWETLKESVRPAPLSPKRLAEYCAANDIPVLKSRAKDDDECTEWMEEHGTKHPVIGHLRDFTAANTMLKTMARLGAMRRADDTVPMYLKYFGAHTGRFSGDQKVNWLNQRQEEKFGIHMRALLLPPPGHTFVDVDLSQIEPRILAWLGKNKHFIDSIATGMSPYEAHARETMGWAGGELKRENSKLYNLAKGRVLAGGYQCGFYRFLAMIPRYGIKAEEVLNDTLDIGDEREFTDYLEHSRADDAPTLLARYKKFIANEDFQSARIWVNSWKTIRDFREQEKHTTRLWARMQKAMEAAARSDRHFELELPNGRIMHYFNVANHEGLSAQVSRGGKRSHYYGGMLTENAAQATAREVFTEALLATWDAGHLPVLHVYDQILTSVPTAEGPAALAEIIAIMSRTPTWLPGLPLSAEGKLSDRYTK